MRSKYILWAFFIGVFAMSCSSNQNEKWKLTDLMSHGLPLKVKAPADLKVTKSSLGGSQEYKLYCDQGYGMNILVMDATSGDVQSAITELEEIIKQGKYFDSIVESTKDGFIYKMTVTENHSVFGFRKVQIQGDKQYVFQNPYMSKLTEGEAKELFDAVPTR